MPNDGQPDLPSSLWDSIQRKSLAVKAGLARSVGSDDLWFRLQAAAQEASTLSEPQLEKLLDKLRKSNGTVFNASRETEDELLLAAAHLATWPKYPKSLVVVDMAWVEQRFLNPFTISQRPLDDYDSRKVGYICAKLRIANFAVLFNMDIESDPNRADVLQAVKERMRMKNGITVMTSVRAEIKGLVVPNSLQ